MDMDELDDIDDDLSPRGISRQGQGYSMSASAMDVMDDLAIGGIGNSPRRILDMDRSGDTMGGLAPIFPPQNFDLPDISFSNSVSPNVNFNQSLLSSAQMLGNTSTLYSSVTTPSSHVGPTQLSHAGASRQQQGTYFPSASQSPPGTSSSDDSDDLPLAQLAKRGITNNAASHAGATASVASPVAPSTDTTSMEGSPVSGTASKKAKQTKKRKKKDPNEPQKPVSAYALFFRDTQATIKGHNPSASFGEVSKIVASMWDQLDPEHKDVYKKKTEMAKKQYLKQLAAYRASQVSQTAADEAEKSPSPPGVGSLTLGGMSGNFQTTGVGSPSASNTPVTMAGEVMRPHIQQQSPPYVMQVSSHMQQQQQMQQQLTQQQHMNYNQISKSSPPHKHSPPQEMSTVAGSVYNSPPHVSQPGPTNYQPAMMHHSNAFGFSDSGMNMEVNYPQCIRSGCKNHAKENPAWDSEYCSNECVITHCRDIFKTWAASRSGSNSYPVK